MIPWIFCFTCGCFLDYEKMFKTIACTQFQINTSFMAVGHALFPAAFYALITRERFAKKRPKARSESAVLKKGEIVFCAFNIIKF
jgi:hypothetical protein